MITKKTTPKITHLTINNYSQFQDSATNRKPDSNHTTTTYNKSNKVINNKSYDRFEIFWDKYPRKVAKKKAHQIWKTKKLDKIYKNIVNGLESYLNSEAWKKDGGAFIPHPTTFLNQERWDDEVQVKVLTSEDIKELNEKKQNRRFQEQWKKSSKQSAREEEVKTILKDWKKKKINL